MGKIIFLHPDLGIGGAERSMIDAALALKSRGHSVEFVTSHHDPSHCFKETCDGSLTVTVAGDWLPRTVCGRLYVLCAYARMIYTAIYMLLFKQFDLICCDQISACIPFLKLSGKKILFYCHFPDMLLTSRDSWIKRVYRAPIDWLEEKTTGMADVVLVNSKFTAAVFADTFRSLRHIRPDVLYPIPNFAALDQPAPQLSDGIVPAGTKTVFLSINRFERKKNLQLAIEALSALAAERDLNGVHLIMAGGYDERVRENKEHYIELRHLVTKQKLDSHVTFLRSFSDAEKRSLLSLSTCLLYTPDKEHFGIVPIEAMYLRCPVIAVNSGGPLETVAHEQTGFLCEQTPSAFCNAMYQFMDDRSLSKTMGETGRERVKNMFSFQVFTNQFNDIVEKLL